MTSTLSVIILTYNERLHIQRSIASVAPLAKEIFVVDCHSSDGTQALAREAGATVVEHDWPGNQAEQLNWALASLPITGDWVLRLDADEYLTLPLQNEIAEKLDSLPESTCAVLLLLRHTHFMSYRLRFGGPPLRILRLWRRGTAVCEERLMDERMTLLRGETVSFNETFVDDNLNDLTWWTQKHLNYAWREAAVALLGSGEQSSLSGTPPRRSRRTKRLYYRLPVFWRATAYFLYRYLFRLGFLDGKGGFLWHFFQAWWYRALVDADILELQAVITRSKGDAATIRAFLESKGVRLPKTFQLG